MSNDTVSATRDKVRRILTDKLGSVRLTNDDKFIVQHNSAVLFVSVEEGVQWWVRGRTSDAH